jgi:hypothetical protein
MAACPACGKELDAATALGGDDAKPRVGDFTICLYCGALQRFTATGGLEPYEVPASADKETRQRVALARAFIVQHRRKAGQHEK